MTLIEVLLAIGNDQNREFRRPGKCHIRIGNGIDHIANPEEYDRTPFYRFELARAKGTDKIGDEVFLSIESYDAHDWEIVV